MMFRDGSLTVDSDVLEKTFLHRGRRNAILRVEIATLGTGVWLADRERGRFKTGREFVGGQEVRNVEREVVWVNVSGA